MPAERMRDSTQSDGVESTWSILVDASKAHNVAFAPNITPETFNDAPSLARPPPESVLFPVFEFPSGKRRGHGKKKLENHIPRPPNAFILFRSSFINNKHVSPDVETNHSTLSKIIGLTWHNLPHEERQMWYNKARIALEEHRRKYPQYTFRPSPSSGMEKRKVREVGTKDMKRCSRIAELLAQGLKGDRLRAAMAEFDRRHVPETVIRFETPITAQTYRRSSSKPVYLKTASSNLSTVREINSYHDSPNPSQGGAKANDCDGSLALPVVSPPTWTLPENDPLVSYPFSLGTSIHLAPFEFNNTQESRYEVVSPQATNGPYTTYADSLALSTMAVDTSSTYLDVLNTSVPPMGMDKPSMPVGFDLPFDLFGNFSTPTTDVIPDLSADFSTSYLSSFHKETDHIVLLGQAYTSSYPAMMTPAYEM